MSYPRPHTTMRRSLRLRCTSSLASVTALLAAGCASTAAAPQETVSVTPNNVRIETPTGDVEAHTVAEDRSVTQTIKANPDVAWSKLPAVFTELQLPVSGYLGQSRQITAKGVRVRGHLGKLRMSQIVTCGSDITGDDKANTYEVTLDVAAAISPADGGQTNVNSMVTASARPMAVSGDAVRCVTTGSLERRIATMVLLKTATP
jgi:hypothetical protein